MSLSSHYLGKPGTLLFCNATMQRRNAVACSKTLALETCSDSIWYFIGFTAECLR